MSAAAVAMVLLAALLHALRNLFTKTSGNKTAFVFWYELVGVLLIAPWGLHLLLRHQGWTWAGISLCLLSGAIHGLYWVTHAKSYEGGDLSHVYPIMRSSPALVYLLAVPLLGEPVTWPGALGVLIVTIGVYSINLPGFSPARLWLPIAALRDERHTRLAFLTLALSAAYSIVDKFGVRHFHPVLFLFLFQAAGLAGIAAWVLLGPDRADAGREWRTNRGPILANGVLAMASYGLVLAALRSEEVSKVVSLRQSSVIFGSLLGVLVLKEGQGPLRLAAGALIAAGCVLLSL
jgi:drug/metabolite transporter (DMT)-like permease